MHRRAFLLLACMPGTLALGRPAPVAAGLVDPHWKALRDFAAQNFHCVQAPNEHEVGIAVSILEPIRAEMARYEPSNYDVGHLVRSALVRDLQEGRWTKVGAAEIAATDRALQVLAWSHSCADR